METGIEDLSVVIQAGGESKRMGTPKAFVDFMGEPLIMRSVRRLFPICGEMVITTNEPEKMGFLDPYVQTGRMRFARDATDRRGALIGMDTALSNASKPFVAMVACDMVFPSPDILSYLQGLLADGDYDVAIPRTSMGYEPFHAVYRRGTCMGAVKDALADGRAKATSWFGGVKVREATADELYDIYPLGKAFVNVNTPDELRAVERAIVEHGLD